LLEKKLEHTFIDLGVQPLCESYLNYDQLNQMEPFFPLHVYVCDNCFLVQLQEYVSPKEIFKEHMPISHLFQTLGWHTIAKEYVQMITEKQNLDKKSFVVEIASNDGLSSSILSLKRNTCFGHRTCANVAKVAIEKNIRTIIDFFGLNLRLFITFLSTNQSADLIIGNNVLAQVVDLNDFVEGLKTLLKPSGVITL